MCPNCIELPANCVPNYHLPNVCENHRSANDLQGLLCTDAARNGSNTSDNRCMDWTFVVHNLSIFIAQDRIADTGLRIAVLCLR